jgi:hypothetical protein
MKGAVTYLASWMMRNWGGSHDQLSTEVEPTRDSAASTPGVGMEGHLLVDPLGCRVAVQVVLQQRQRHNQRQQALPVVLDEAQELQPTADRHCRCPTGDSSGSPSGAGALSAWIRWLVRRDANDKNSESMNWP